MTTHDAELREFLEHRAEAQQSKDIDRLMAHYDPEVVYYDVVPPLRFSGTEEVRRNFLRWFDGYEGSISLETHDRTLLNSGDLAFANMLHLDSGVRKGGLQASIWVRETTCLRRANGRWLITHEHVSIPIDPRNMQVWLASDKDQSA
ncbi:YybH family protein [Nocardia goodfellowii]|uniref:Ketosteroid isomerase-like protein n=1 Tax=Nocardia goodfellowii TaxID=882446 RepID=A0ABS4QPP4_9NOCA|nr:nuclear transport factor 2 family protein [Nocardia goodfellowii]MBP2192611.1 ketosteroid isomerase-like protein [Nocardia goodfellowii]